MPWRGRSSATLSASGQAGGAEGHKIVRECVCVCRGGQVVSVCFQKVVDFFASMGYLRLQGFITTNYIVYLLTLWYTRVSTELAPPLRKSPPRVSTEGGA